MAEPIERMDKSEVGRELRASELRERTIVVIEPPLPVASWPGVMFTMHIVTVTEAFVIFFSGVQRASVVSFKTPADGLEDGKGRVVRVFEYLGDP